MAPNSNFPWEELHCEWLWVYDGWFPHPDIWSHSIVVPTSVFFVREGHSRIDADGVVSEVPRGEGFLAAAGVRRHWFATRTRLLSVGFRVTWRDGAPLALNGLNRPIGMANEYGKALFAASERLFREIHAPKRTVGYWEAVESVQDSRFAQWCRREGAFRHWLSVYAQTLDELGLSPEPRKEVVDRRLKELIERLDSWPLRESLDWGRLGEGLTIGNRRLEQLFCAELGLTPHAYLDRRRITVARTLLSGSTQPLKAIAFETGFRYASHFTKWFRRHTGIAPSTFRQSAASAA